MDLKQIEKLMGAMQDLGIKRVALKKEGFEIEIERECASAPAHVVMSQAPAPILAPPPVAAGEARPKNVVEHHAPESKPKLPGVYVTSPMVGTYYAAPSPQDPPFVKVGDTVAEGTVVCIIEAMKVMNEVKAGVKGRVAEILSRSGDPVEFGTHIFRIEP